MPIISEARFQKKEKLKIEINVETLNQINEYCAWANINSTDYFIQEAVDYLFSKDREWKQFKKGKKSSKKRNVAETTS